MYLGIDGSPLLYYIYIFWLTSDLPHHSTYELSFELKSDHMLVSEYGQAFR